MARTKPKPGEIYHTDITKKKIADTQKMNVLLKKNNLSFEATCEHCNQTMQLNMIKRWHGDKCEHLKYKLERTWSYISPKLRGKFEQ